MTKYRKPVKKHVEVKDGFEETRTTCDFCQRDVTEVPKSSWDYSRIKIDAKIGSSYPECDSRQGYRLDCCIECFAEKLKPAVEALGVAWHEYSPEDMYISDRYSNYWEDETPVKQ